ncbi:MAG: hypothetical protein WCK98_02480 [bacterium]
MEQPIYKPLTVEDDVYTISEHEPFDPHKIFNVNGSVMDESDTAYLARTGQLPEEDLRSLKVVPIEARERLKKLIGK